jgi:hypothetical protein
MLRHFAMEGSEIHSGIERDLAVFIAHGVAVWLLLNRDGRNTQQTIWTKPYQRYYAENLTVLLANMMEG